MNEYTQIGVSNPFFRLIVTGKQAMKPSTAVCWKIQKKTFFVGIYFSEMG